jgi:ribonuclease Z
MRMAIDVHVLGTASARPTPDRAVSGSLVKGPDGIAVIDAGEGFQTRYARQRRRLKKHAVGETLKPSSVDVLAFTHGHLDHTWGALPWLQSMDLENRQQPLLVLGPTSAAALDALLEGTPLPDDVPPADLARQWLAWYGLGGAGLHFPNRWVLGDVNGGRWVEVNPETGGAVLLEGMPQPEGWTNSTLVPVPTAHTVPSCGWMVQQHAMAGRFDRARADDLGLTTKERAQLARGEDVARDDGELLEAEWFRGGERAPISVLISGDTATRPPAWDEDVAPTLLIHESTFLDEQQDKADEHQHSTAAGAVASARAVGASCLALTHYSNRIKSSQKAQEEAERVAEGLPVVALNDNDRMVVKDDGSVNHLSWNDGRWWGLNITPNR